MSGRASGASRWSNQPARGTGQAAITRQAVLSLTSSWDNSSWDGSAFFPLAVILPLTDKILERICFCFFFFSHFLTFLSHTFSLSFFLNTTFLFFKNLEPIERLKESTMNTQTLYLDGVLTLHPITFGAGEFVVVGACPVHCGMLSSIPDLYPLDAGGIPSTETTENISDITKCPLGGKIATS